DLEFEQMRPPVSPPLRAGSPESPPVAAPPPPPQPVAPPPPSMTPAEVTQTLAGLADLRDRGAITPEEYEAKKADLLGRLSGGSAARISRFRPLSEAPVFNITPGIIILIAIFLLVAFPVHEFAHAFVAYRLGDSTARLFGRLTLNPIVHFDPIGGFALILT